MISYTSNISQVVKLKVAQLEAMAGEGDKLARTVALAVLPEIKKRVHIEGKDATGAPIGTYSPAYMKVRTGSFSNSEKFAKGKNVGKNKNAGTFSKGSSQGAARPRFNRTADTKVILSLTRQMENDLSVVPSGSGYGIGYNNPENFKKSQWNEATYKKKIWKLTPGETELALNTAIAYVEDKLKTA